MKDNLFVGGFPFKTTEQELAAFFQTCGTVLRVKILMDRETKKSRGIAFVKMSGDAEGLAAIAKLNDATMGGRKIFVTEAKPPGTRQGSGPTAKPGAKPAAKPGFVERRSGKDRRRTPGASAGGRKKWERKPGGFGAKRPFRPAGERGFPQFKEKKDFRQGKWEPKPGDSGGKKPRRQKPEDPFSKFKKKKSFAPRKYVSKPGGFGPKRPERKPGGFRRGGKGGGG